MDRSEKLARLVTMDNFDGVKFLGKADLIFKHEVDDSDRMAGDSFCGALRKLLQESGVQSRIVDFQEVELGGPVPTYAVLSYHKDGTPWKLYMLTPVNVNTFDGDKVASFDYPKFAVVDTEGDLTALYRLSGSDYEIWSEETYIINYMVTGTEDLEFWMEMIVNNL